MVHTPGPWVTDCANPELVAQFTGEKYLYIADFDPHSFAKSDISQEEYEANAKLGASAPDLLAACETALDIICWMSGSSDFGLGGQAYRGWLKAQAGIDSIRAAIARVKGKEKEESDIDEVP